MRLFTTCWCRIKASVTAMVGDFRGVSAVEYALMVVAVIAAVGGLAVLLGGAFDDLFNQLSKQISAAPKQMTT